MQTYGLRDTHLGHQESTLDLLAKWHSQSPQEETFRENNCFNLGKEPVEVLFVLLDALQAIPAMQTFRRPDKENALSILGIDSIYFTLLYDHC